MPYNLWPQTTSKFKPRNDSLPDPHTVVYVQSDYTDFVYKKIEIDCPTVLPDWDFTLYENRLVTFALCEWDLSRFGPEILAEIGFYYVVQKNILKCVFCFMEIKYQWSDKEDPVKKHKREHPLCSIFRSHRSHEISGTIADSNVVVSKGIKLFESFIRNEGISDTDGELQELVHLSFLITRLQTFNECHMKLVKNVRELCDAGFYYGGDGWDDSMICFCCEITISNWHLRGEPWFEHAYHSPKCSFLLLNKGVNFVKYVLGNFNTAEQLDMRNIFHRQDNIRHYQKLKALPNVHNLLWNHINPGFGTIESESVIRYPLPDWMLCKICLREKIEVIFLHCHHLISCISCAVTQNLCGVCREPILISMRVFIRVDHRIKKLKKFLLDMDFMNDEKGLCVVCREEEMSVVFMPCRHVHACYKCAITRNDCPICFTNYFALLQVFL